MILLIKKPWKLVHEEDNEDFMVIVGQKDETRIIGIYIRPDIGKIRYGRCLEALQK